MFSGLRRMLAVLCAAILLFTLTAPSYADGIDLSRMTDEEISSLLEQVNLEIVSRGIQKTAKLAKGAYIAGRDIPAGTYVYTCLAVGSDWGSVTVYSDGGDGDQLLWEVVSAPEEGQEPEAFLVTLKEGDRLKSGVPFSLTIFSGIRFE